MLLPCTIECYGPYMLDVAEHNTTPFNHNFEEGRVHPKNIVRSFHPPAVKELLLKAFAGSWLDWS